MAVLMSLGGNAAGDGFLLNQLDSTYDAELALWTDAGTANVTLQASPNPAGLVFSTTGPIALSTVPTIVTVHSTLQSASRGDTTIQVLDGAAVVASFTVTSIVDPVINFNGRFEARFATANASPFSNKMYTAAVDTIPFPAGWTWGLEGEPDFVPAVGNVPTNLEMTGVGRVIRLNNPVALRSHADPVVTTVVSIAGQVSTLDPVTGNNIIETFTVGDPLIGQPVNFGPHTYFAGNRPAGTASPEEIWSDAYEPLGLFEIRLGTSFTPPAIYFRGASQVGPLGSGMTGLDKHTRNPDSRPIADGLPDAPDEFDEFGLPHFVATFSDSRIDQLLADYGNPMLPEGTPGTPERRNVIRRIRHLLGSASPAKVLAVRTAHPGPDGVPETSDDVFTPRVGTLTDFSPTGIAGWWAYKEDYTGKVDTDLHAWPGGSPGASSVVDYLRQFFVFDVDWHAFAFHSDELCGYHKGSLSGDISMTGNHIGDPHVHTVNGMSYDFQAVGEFTLLRNGEMMEVQVRQSPVNTANPVTDQYSGLTVCVSINTAVAARVGNHRISYQPGREGPRLHFYLDGKPAQLPVEGLALDRHWVSAFDANGEIGLRIDYDDGTVVTITPMFWNAHNVSYIDVSVANTGAHEGVMGIIPQDSWLPRLRNGRSLGAIPASLNARYAQLYKTFANSWRVTKKTSLFVYAPGTSTATFTDRDWPGAQPPCNLKPQFQIPGVGVFKGMPIPEAEAICRSVIDKDLHDNCVFDVATTGDETFVRGYLTAQESRVYGTGVRLSGYVPAMLRPDRSPDAARMQQVNRLDQWLALTARVAPLTPGRPTPTGTVTFFVDGVPTQRAVELDDTGAARLTVGPLKPGEHQIRATYSGGGRFDNLSGVSSTLLHTVLAEPVDKVKRQ
jgi:hypothetical protein